MKNEPGLERMDDFFAARVESYDAHMLNNVAGCREGYRQLAAQVPAGVRCLLDLGCGTGLQLEAIFAHSPGMQVTGIDLTREMLDELQHKYAGKALELICGDYFEQDLGCRRFDVAISFETMHHFGHEKKLGLYRNIYTALLAGGRYVECDYMVLDQAEEDHWFAENARIRAQQGIPEGVFYHYDTPCTVQNQITLLGQAGFARVRQVWRQENTTLLVAEKA